MTLDSSLQRLHREKEERRRKKSTSARRSLAINDSICYMCMHEDPPLNVDTSDSEDDEVEWVGCDHCDRWYHINMSAIHLIRVFIATESQLCVRIVMGIGGQVNAKR